MMQKQTRMSGVHMPAAPLLMGMGLLLLCIVFRRELTATMALHMLVHLPAILLAGVFVGSAACARQAGRSRQAQRQSRGRDACRGCATYNEQGIAGLLLVTLVLAFWMIPKALDDVLVSEWVHALKFASLFAAGMVLFASMRQAQNVVKLFFVGNFSWMTAIAGILYQEHATRLCNFYLLGDQAFAGIGLVAYAVVLPVGGLAAHYVKG